MPTQFYLLSEEELLLDMESTLDDVCNLILMAVNMPYEKQSTLLEGKGY
jgi:hypothetical protein